MLIKKTYQIFKEEEKKLVYKEYIDDKGNKVSYNDHQGEDLHQVNFEYDTDGRLIEERELDNGVETSRTEYLYNSNGDIINTKIFVADELFEELQQEFFETGFLRRTIRHGEEVERMAEHEEGEKSVREFFNDSELIERHIGRLDPESMIEIVEIFDKDDQLRFIDEYHYDSNKKILKHESRDLDGNLMVLSERTYQNDRLIFEKHEDYINGTFYETIYEYDENGNLLSLDSRTPSGEILDYLKQEFDSQNRLKREAGISNQLSNSIYGRYSLGNNFIYEHEYHQESR